MATRAATIALEIEAARGDAPSLDGRLRRIERTLGHVRLQLWGVMGVVVLSGHVTPETLARWLTALERILFNAGVTP